MKTYVRYSLNIRSGQYPYKAPEHIEKIAEEVREKYKIYEIKTKSDIFLIPVDSQEYTMIFEYEKRFGEYSGSLMFFENKFTKSEMEEAQYYLLKCTSAPVEVVCDELKTYKRCCENSMQRGEQIGYYKMAKKEMGNKKVAFSYDYRFILSVEAKEAIQSENCTNFKVMPVYDRKEKEVIAYQLCADVLLPELSLVNHLEIEKQCPKCNSTEWRGIHHVPHPFYIPKEWEKELLDFNYTSEKFSLGSRYCIISKKVYQLLLNLGARKISCEPIVFV